MSLIFAANHIGNPQDFPARSKTWLHDADLLIFEEDRAARQALKLAGLHRSYFKLNEHDHDVLAEIREALLNKQNVLYMSDQGMPNIADPGHLLLQFAYDHGVQVQVIPGPSSITAALAAYPLPLNEFHYLGFLPRQEKDRRAVLQSLVRSKAAQIILDTPYRRQQLLDDCVKTLGGQRQALLAVDISGEREQFHFAQLKHLATLYPGEKKLNFVLIIS